MNINNALAWGLLFIAQTGFATDCKNIEQEIKDIQTNYESKFQTLKKIRKTWKNQIFLLLI